MRTSIWALVLVFGPCFVYSEIVISSNVGNIAGKDLRVDSGITISLTCTISNDGGEEGQALWYGPELGLAVGTTLLHHDSDKYSISKELTSDGSATMWTLQISDLNIDDEGTYKCHKVAAQDKTNLNVFVTTAAFITNITSLQTATVGQQVNLQCKVRGSPTPTTRWRHTRPNNKLPNGIEGEYKKGTDLQINSITLDDRGEYECITSNGIPNENSKQTRTTFIRMDYKPVVEAITDDNPEVKVPIGDPATLQCKSMAYPRATAGEVSWYLDDVQINEMDGITIETVHELPAETQDKYEETTYTTLQILEVTSNSTGSYKCQFTNTQGASEAVIVLQIGEPVTIDGNDPCCRASALSISLVTLVSMVSAILSLVH